VKKKPVRASFRYIRKRALPYIDKSAFIAQVIDCTAQVALLLRPARFGRSLSISMLRHYFERGQEDLSQLFAGLRIHEMGERYRAELHRYPVQMRVGSMQGA
jgi:hypothetical protein